MHEIRVPPNDSAKVDCETNRFHTQRSLELQVFSVPFFRRRLAASVSTSVSLTAWRGMSMRRYGVVFQELWCVAL